MSVPRPVVPGGVLFVTRRCVERRFMLRPGAGVRAALEYLLAVAAARCGVEVIAAVVMSNHYHLLIHDVLGCYPAFVQWFDGLVARVMNWRLGRTGRFWDEQRVHVEYCLGAADIEQKIAYILCNPVRAGLVERGRDWPGLRTTPQGWVRSRAAVGRPGYFRRGGVMPEEATLAVSMPPTHGDMTAAAFAGRIARLVSAEEERLRVARAASGRAVLGVQGLRRQGWGEAPRTPDGKGERGIPLVAGEPEARLAALMAICAFRAAHADAMVAWRARKRRVRFPAGTWKMRCVHNAPWHPPPGMMAALLPRGTPSQGM